MGLKVARRASVGLVQDGVKGSVNLVCVWHWWNLPAYFCYYS